MKDKLCFRKYKNKCILYSILLVLALGLSLLMGNIRFLAAVLCVLAFGSFVAYYLYAYMSYSKKAMDMIPEVGTICNWKSSGHRSRWGCVVLCHNETEYCSPYYFSTYEAEGMVGKDVSYVIIEDTLLIYDILN